MASGADAGSQSLSEINSWVSKINYNQTVHNNLHADYMKTDFICTELKIIIRPEQVCPELDKILIEKKLTTAAFITAWNPQSKSCSKEVNDKNNTELKKDLFHFSHFDGIGKAPDYAGEDSFLVLGISLAKAKKLQLKHNQKAIVFYELGSVGELIYLPS